MNFRKNILHPVTALMLACSSFLFVDRYDLMDFTYAPYWMFAVVLVSFLMLSRKYDAFLTYVCLVAALFVTYKAAMMPSFKALPVVADQELIQKKLQVVGSLVDVYQIQHKKLPTSLKEAMAAEVTLPGYVLDFCASQTCLQKINDFSKTPFKDSRFVVTAQSKKNAEERWFLEDKMEFYKSNQTGDIQRILP